MTDLKSLTLPEMTAFLQSLGEPAFRGRQVFTWLHRGVTDFDGMTNLSKSLREKLKETCFITAPQVARKQVSRLDGTIKYLWELSDGNCIETVLMQYHHGNTVCISSQVGCRMGCAFCASTIAGKVRDLTPAEMIAEELFPACHDYFDKTGRRISFEYAMIDGVNDHDWQADLIARKLRGMPGHVNLIPLNDVVESPYKPSRRIGAFQKRLESHGITATVRRSLGGDIDASCGQLRRKAMEEAQKGECSQ